MHGSSSRISPVLQLFTDLMCLVFRRESRIHLCWEEAICEAWVRDSHGFGAPARVAGHATDAAPQVMWEGNLCSFVGSGVEVEAMCQ